MSKKEKLRLAASCAVAMLISQSAYATDYTWTNATSGNWTDTPNWTPNTGIPVAGDTATFNASGVNGAETIFLNGNQAASSLTFNNTGTTNISTGTAGDVANQQLLLTGGITVNSGAGQVSIGGSGSNSAIVFINGAVTFTNNLAAGTANRVNFDSGTTTSNTTIESVSTNLTNIVTTQGTGDFLFGGSFRNNTVNGNIGLVASGTGTVELDGASSQFGDGTVLNSGTLALKSSNALGTNATTLTLNGGSLVDVGGARTIPAAVSLTFGGDIAFGQGTLISGSAAPTFSGTVNLGGATRTLTLNNSLFLAGAITNGGITTQNTLLPNGNTTLSLGSTGNTYSGATTINTGGILNVTQSNMLSPNSAIVLKTNTTMNLNLGGSETAGSLSDGGGTGATVFMGNVSADNFTAGGDNTNTTFSGVFTGLDTNNNGGVTKAGSGTWTLTGASPLNGYVNVSAGTLAFTTIGDVGVSTSSLLAPSTVANGTIGLGLTTTDGGLKFVGTAPASSNRVLNLAGTTGGGVVDASGGSGDPITFTSNLTATGVGAKTLTLTGTNTDANTLGGSIPDSSGGATSLAKTGTGNWILTGASTYTGGTSVSGGKLSLQTNLLTSSSVSVTAGTLELAAGAGQMRVIHTPTVSVTGTGMLDVQDNKLIVTTTPIGGATAGVYDSGSVQGMVQAGRNGGSWNGVGVVTSQAAASGASALTTLGVDTAADVKGISGSQTATWGGQTVSPTDTLVMYTYAGDANLNGLINGDDYFKIDNGYANHLTGYANGDFNYDGVINADDYFIIDKNYSEQMSAFPNSAPSGLAGVSAVPEPASLALLGLATAGLFGRRRRQR